MSLKLMTMMALLQSITVASVSEPSSNVTRTSDWKIADEQIYIQSSLVKRHKRSPHVDMLSLLKPMARNPEERMTPQQMIRHRGYPVETHKVITDDGYILELHRIPHGKISIDRLTKKPVLLQHGFLGSSADWLLGPTNKSLAYLLADRGYDVWLGNMRGNSYSRSHVMLDPESEQFWNYSWDEIGEYDIPAAINYILERTKRSKLIYIGHSLGCSVFFVAMTKHRHLNAKVETMTAMAPASTIANKRNVFRHMLALIYNIQALFRPSMNGPISANDSMTRLIQQLLCRQNYLQALICREVVFSVFGRNVRNYALEPLSNLYAHYFSGASLKLVAHFAQSLSTNSYANFDYGPKGNLQRYGTRRPPNYNLQHITVPTYVFYGENDYVTTPQDVKWLAKRLGNLKSIHKVADRQFCHLDFLIGKNVNQVLYNHVIGQLPAAE